MKLTLAATCIVLFCAGVILAQAPSQMPKPGPEHKRLSYFVGKWDFEFEMRASPFGPAGKVTGVDQSEMMPGGFFLVTHTDGKGTMGQLKGLSVMGYDAQEKVYTYHAFNNFGELEQSKGTVHGDTWTWTSESRLGGQPTKTRFTLKEESATSYSMKLETSADGTTWTNVMEGKATKAK